MSAQPLDDLGGHTMSAPQACPAAEVPNSLPGHTLCGTQGCTAGQGQFSAAAKHDATSILNAPLRLISPTDQDRIDAHARRVGGGQTSDRAIDDAAPTAESPGRDITPAGGATASAVPTMSPPRLLDPFLALSADVVGDLEAVRTANENRLRQLTRTATDADGEDRGFGLDDSHPDVARLRAIVGLIGQAEHDAVLQLQRAMRRHALGPWVKATVGIGEKQAARLLATIGDPYWNTLHDRPRTVSELWAYCGLKPGQRRRRGEKANWSADAKSRAYLCAESCIKHARSPYRPVYDERRTATAERLHAAPCVRCGPSGKPAPEGSPWSAGHQHADALRIVSKRILRDLWRAARDQHGEGGDPYGQGNGAHEGA